MDKVMEIYFSDLSPIAQKEFLDVFGEVGNADIIPIAVLVNSNEEDE